jgi:hypothetical protein
VIDFEGLANGNKGGQGYPVWSFPPKRQVGGGIPLGKPEISIPVYENKVFVVDIDDNVSSSRFSVNQPTWFVLTASFNPWWELTWFAIIPCQKHGFFAYLPSSGIGNPSRTVIIKIRVFDKNIDR